jgi:hypothetical protein
MLAKLKYKRLNIRKSSQIVYQNNKKSPVIAKKNNLSNLVICGQKNDPQTKGSQAGRPRSGGLVCISESQEFQDRKHFAWCSFRFAGEMPASQDRGRLACKRLYSTANERGFDLKRFFVCLSAKCRRDARDPVVSPAFQDRRNFRIANISSGVPSDSQAKCQHPRIAGVSPASGCTQPPMSEI